MTAPEIPADEAERLDALHHLNILDTIPEAAFDALTELASIICEVPISLVSLVDADRQWFKSRVGLHAQETPRSASFCAHAILAPSEPFVIENTLTDERFADNPLVAGEPRIRAYAGIPIVSPRDNQPIGTLCVIDTDVRSFSDDQIRSLQLLGTQTEQLLQLRLDQQTLKTTARNLRESNESLGTFAQVAAHDLKSPIRGIRSLVSFIRQDHGDVLASAEHDLQRIDERAAVLMQLIDDLLTYSRLPLDAVEAEDFAFAEEINQLCQSLDSRDEITIEVHDLPSGLNARRVPLLTCVRNLVDNAVRHHPGPHGAVTISLTTIDPETVELSVTDDGAGIDPAHHDAVLEPFSRLPSPSGQPSTGLGLSAVRRLAQRHGGHVTIESAIGHGSTFRMTWPGQVHDDALQIIPVAASTGTPLALMSRQPVSPG